MSAVQEKTVGQRRIVTTAEMIALLEQGCTVRLPQVASPGGAVLAHYDAADVQALAGAGDPDNDVVSIDYVGQEEVQCISVVDGRHLYLTDDFVPTHNTSNIVFLKSTDDTMIETLAKMSGTRHVAYVASKTITKDVQQANPMGNVDGKVSYTMSLEQEAVVTYNMMARIPERNSIVFRAGDAPVVNRNETILPMSWKLFANDIPHPGHDEYTLQTIPTLSSALEFDVRKNQPDFEGGLLAKRMRQACTAVHAKEVYRLAYGYTPADIARLDPDVYSNEVMELVDAAARENMADDNGGDPDSMSPDEIADEMGTTDRVDEEVALEVERAAATRALLAEKLYAEHQISKEMLVTNDGKALVHPLDEEIIEACKAAGSAMERDGAHFSRGGNGELCSADGSVVYLRRAAETVSLRQLEAASEDPDAGVWTEEAADMTPTTGLATFEVMPAMYEYLASLPSWKAIASGEFDRSMAQCMRSKR